MFYQLSTGGILLLLTTSVLGSSGGANSNIVKKIHENKANLMEKHSQGLHLNPVQHRFLEQGSDTCDVAFVQCLPDIGCVDCFAQLELLEIDWSGVTPGTACDDVVKILHEKGYCEKLKEGSSSDVFCKTYEACVVWPGQDDDAAFADDDTINPVNCTALEKCEWEGMHKNWIGDGVCHDNMGGCYNTAVCGWDGGDCCEDTCNNQQEENEGDDDYVECGHDGFACRDPKSANCDPELTDNCPGKSDDGPPSPSSVKCASDEDKYRLMMYDSFGDGWDKTKVKITPKTSKKTIFEGGLEIGSEGLAYICLSKDPTCYNAVTNGGIWGVESSWEIKPLKEGSVAIAGSGAPNNCDFSVAGDDCDKTCTGRPDSYPSDDPDYTSFKKLYECVEDKCLIQLGQCQNDKVCKSCFVQDAPDFCYSVETFAAVIDCSVCKCTEKKSSPFCQAKPGPGVPIPPEKKKDENNVQECTAAETMAGAKAVMDFSKCSNMDQMSELVTKFDNENFGALDSFETCAHSFADDENHGGHTALGCLKILHNAITNPIVKDNPDAPKEAIMALAEHIYTDGENFCDCAKKSSEDCPLCPSFMNFKTLLYEAMDACKALDEIDCDSWNEYWRPCQDNLNAKFGKTDFSTHEQCEFAIFGCGGVGAFPAFRRLDCGAELEKEAWDYYKLFDDKCIKTYEHLPTPAPVNTPTNKPIASPTNPPVGKPTQRPYIPDSSPVPYIPSDSTPTSSSEQKSATGPGKKKGHFFRNFFILCLLGAGGYYVYKKRFDTFNFVQYRRRGFGGGGYNMMYGGESEMYGNMNSSTTFEPPTLPPAMFGTEMT